MKSRRKIIIILVVVLALLSIAAVGYYIYTSRQKSDKEKENLQSQNNGSKKIDQSKTTTETTKETTETTPLCASTLTDSDKIMIETWKTYTNSTYKYSFKYPENWVTTENKTDSVLLSDESDKTSFQFQAGVSGGSTDGMKKTSEKEVTISCERATVRYYETIVAVPDNDHYITASFKKNGTWYMVDMSYKFIGASLSSDIVEAYDLILKTIEFK